jgi:hypothetical protein
MLGSIRRHEEEEVFGVQDWAEVHRLDREGVPKRVHRQTPVSRVRLAGNGSRRLDRGVLETASRTCAPSFAQLRG